MWGVSFVVRRGGGGILDVWTSRFDWAIQHESCYWCDNARWGCLHFHGSVFLSYSLNLTLGITGRNSGKSKAGPSLGKKKVHQKSLLSRNVQFDAPLLLAPSDRPCSTRWEKNSSFYDYSSFTFTVSWFRFSWELYTYKPGSHLSRAHTYKYSHF